LLKWSLNWVIGVLRGILYIDWLLWWLLYLLWFLNSRQLSLRLWLLLIIDSWFRLLRDVLRLLLLSLFFIEVLLLNLRNWLAIRLSQQIFILSIMRNLLLLWNINFVLLVYLLRWICCFQGTVGLYWAIMKELRLLLLLSIIFFMEMPRLS